MHLVAIMRTTLSACSSFSSVVMLSKLDANYFEL